MCCCAVSEEQRCLRKVRMQLYWALTMAAFMSRFIHVHISCASFKATEWLLYPLMLTAMAPPSRHFKRHFGKVVCVPNDLESVTGN